MHRNGFARQISSGGTATCSRSITRSTHQCHVKEETEDALQSRQSQHATACASRERRDRSPARKRRGLASATTNLGCRSCRSRASADSHARKTHPLINATALPLKLSGLKSSLSILPPSPRFPTTIPLIVAREVEIEIASPACVRVINEERMRWLDHKRASLPKVPLRFTRDPFGDESGGPQGC